MIEILEIIAAASLVGAFIICGGIVLDYLDEGTD